MIKPVTLTSFTAALSLLLVPNLLPAAEAAETTVEGTMSCAKCNLSLADSCADVLTVGEGDKAVHYWLEEGGNQKTSEHKCSGSKPATATGTVAERDGKKFLLVSGFGAAAPKTAAVTQTGTMSCAKCNLKLADACADVLTVGEGDKAVHYWLEEDGNQKTSEHKCSGSKPATVTGTVAERDGKKFLLVSGFGAAAPKTAAVTQTGTMSCAKCNLKLADSCADVLTVGEGDKAVHYWLEEDGNQKTSEHKCSGTKPATVTGTVAERDGKTFLLVSGFGAPAAKAAPAPSADATSGTLSCAKCNLGLADACADVLTVGEGDDAVNYWLVENGSQKTSGHKCSGSKPATVAGAVVERDGKKFIEVTGFQ